MRMKNLTEVKKGLYEIKWIIGLSNIMDFLEKCHIFQGANVYVVNQFFGNTIVRTDNKRIALSYDVASQIKV